MGHILYYNKKKEYLRDIVKMTNKPKSLRFTQNKEDALIFFSKQEIVELIHEMINPKTHMHWDIFTHGLDVKDNIFENEGNMYLLAGGNKVLNPGDQLIKISSEMSGIEIVTVHYDQLPLISNKGDVYFERVRVVKPNSDEPVNVVRNHYRKILTINDLSLLEFYGYKFREEIEVDGKTYLVKFMYSLDKICANDMDDKYSYKTFSRSEIIKNK
jgi:hypothetical protein